MRRSVDASGQCFDDSMGSTCIMNLLCPFESVDRWRLGRSTAAGCDVCVSEDVMHESLLQSWIHFAIHLASLLDGPVRTYIRQAP